MTHDPLAPLVSLEGIPSAYAATRDGIDVMLRDRGLRRTSPEMTAESLLRGAHASAVLEGSASTLADVRAGAGDEVAADAVRVSTELLGGQPGGRQRVDPGERLKGCGPQRRAEAEPVSYTHLTLPTKAKV